MNEKYRIIYGVEAKSDLRELYIYIAYQLKEKATAKKVLARVRKAARSLNTFPERHQRVQQEPWASMGMRQFPESNYIIYYLPDPRQKTVTIYRVAYGRRNVPDIMGE